MEESTCHEMVTCIPLSQRFSTCSMLCFFRFFISLKYNFHVDAERMIVKTRDICGDGLKNVPLL